MYAFNLGLKKVVESRNRYLIMEMLPWRCLQQGYHWPEKQKQLGKEEEKRCSLLIN